MKAFQLEEYLSGGVERIIKGILRASLENPRESAFMMQYALSGKAARAQRKKAEEMGRHIPPFLIASITSQCNLHCKGCYARANESCIDESCTDAGQAAQLSQFQWGNIFSEAEALGIGFILLAGGEPLIRRDVLEEAALHRKILFPIFTNGTLLDESYETLFFENRNLIPVFSVEGSQKITDDRRGAGVYKTLLERMDDLKKKGILFGASVTVTKENLKEVTSDAFTDTLSSTGCKAVIYVEYVPVDKRTQGLAPDDSDRDYMNQRLLHLREKEDAMLYISFPGDEKTSGGCLAAGRGFFHINARGGAESCPFSPYSDTNLTEVTLREALESPLFVKLQSGDILTGEHRGGCVLFEQEESVKTLVNSVDELLV